MRIEAIILVTNSRKHGYIGKKTKRDLFAGMVQSGIITDYKFIRETNFIVSFNVEQQHFRKVEAELNKHVIEYYKQKD